MDAKIVTALRKNNLRALHVAIMDDQCAWLNREVCNRNFTGECAHHPRPAEESITATLPGAWMLATNDLDSLADWFAIHS